MTVLGTVIQQPVERLDYDIVYTDWLTVGDEIASVTTSLDQAGITATSSVVGIDRVKVFVQGGTNGVRYKLTVTITTNDGRVKQDELKISIKDA